MSDNDDQTLTLATIKRLMLAMLLIGLVAGGLGGALFVRFGAAHIPVDKKQVLVQESSAVTDVVKKVSPSVVSITSTGTVSSFFGTSQVQGAGSGIIVTSDGLIMTNQHVVADTGAKYTVFTSDGKQYSATVVARNSLNDVAFVRISAKGLKPANLGDSSTLVVGQSVVAIGNALGQFQNTATQGIISGLGRPIVAGDSGSGSSSESLQDLIQTDAAINPGNSGGPLVNLEGQVIGMNTAIAGNAQNIGFAIPINEIKNLVSNVAKDGKLNQPYLGVRYMPITKDLATQQNLSVNQGAYVIGDETNPAVVPGGPADKAGLASGDIIVKVNSDNITDQVSLTALISKYKVGDTVNLTIIRGGKTQTIAATLQAAPQG